MITQIREDPMKGSTRPTSSIRSTSYSPPFSHPCIHPFTPSPRQQPPTPTSSSSSSSTTTFQPPAPSLPPTHFHTSTFHTHTRNPSNESTTSTTSTSSESSTFSDSSTLSTSTSTSSSSTSTLQRNPNPLTKHFLFHMRGHRSNGAHRHFKSRDERRARAAQRTIFATNTTIDDDAACNGGLPVRLLDYAEEWDEWARGVRGVLEPRIVGHGWWAGCGVEEVLGW